MVEPTKTQDRIFTSNVNSGTISIIEKVVLPAPGSASRRSSAASTARPSRKDLHITNNVASGRACEGFDVGINGTESGPPTHKTIRLR